MKTFLNNHKTYKKKIFVPDNIKIEKNKNNLIFNGPLGCTELNLKKLDILGIGALSFLKNNENKKILFLKSTSACFLSCIFSIIKNKIIGVSSGFLISLKMIGIGYKAEIEKNLNNQILYLKVGFSHDLQYIIPTSIKIFLLEPTLICLYGIDKNQITSVSAKIRNSKVPSIYKGKGIFLLNEVILLKKKIGKRK